MGFSHKIKQLTPLALFVAWPFAHFAATNILKEISWSRFILLVIVALLISILVTVLSHLVLRKPRLDRLAIFFGVGFSCLFLFNFVVATPLNSLSIYDVIPVWAIQGPIWLLATLTVLAVVWMLSRETRFVFICSTFAATMLLVSFMQGAYTFATGFVSEGAATENQAARAVKFLDNAVMKPNVFFIILDGHPRLDQAKKILGYDFSAFVDELRERDFFVAENSRSNYAMSVYSISSTLNMDYTLAVGSNPPKSSRRHRRYIHGYNNVVRQFRRYGYYYVHGGDRNFVHCGMAEDKCLERPLTGDLITELERELIRLTPFRLYAAKWPVERFTPNFVAGKLTEISRQPLFVWAHVFSPHDRYFAADCTTDAEVNAENFNLKTVGHDFKERTIIALKCLHPQVTSLMDTIIEKYADAIIVLQSDHGLSFLTDWAAEDWSRDEFDERYSILSAMRLPARCRHMLKDNMTSVNTFRIVFACLSGSEPDLLEDRFFDIGYESTRPVGLLNWPN
jgi:hypothetical protein